jgi:hypothetical protein
MTATKKWTLRGGESFEQRSMTLREMAPVGRIAWDKWGFHATNTPLRDLVTLVYAEGIYHGAMILARKCKCTLPTEGEIQVAIRCKMTLENVFANAYGGSKAIFRCTYDQKVAEDVSFQKATPSGFAEFQVDNPKAVEQMIIGQAYYVEFIPVPKA